MDSGRYKWIALSNVTLGVLLATLDASITLIAMPDIFRGIHLDPLVPSNSFYLLWMILGYLVVTSVLIVSLGRLGDMVGRVRIYNLGFVIYTVASLLLAVDWLDGRGGATYRIRPAGGAPTGWGSARVVLLLAGSVVSLAVFVAVERRSAYPMFRLSLFRIRAFTFGTLSTFLSAVARGGLMFMLVIWLQGVWLPEHGYDFTDTPVWAGIYMLPLTIGMLCAGPTSGYLSDRFGARPFATPRVVLTAAGLGLLLLLPPHFAYRATEPP